MRIIAGEAKGRRIKAPRGRATRPMRDFVREAVFSMLADRARGAKVLDLFAGSGSLGLEALSRGAAEAVFVLSLIHISEPTRLLSISYAVFCLKKKK